MSDSVGIIAKVKDPLVFTELKNFLDMLSGIEIIYITRSSKKLYVVDKDRLDRIGGLLSLREGKQ